MLINDECFILLELSQALIHVVTNPFLAEFSLAIRSVVLVVQAPVVQNQSKVRQNIRAIGLFSFLGRHIMPCFLPANETP